MKTKPLTPALSPSAAAADAERGKNAPAPDGRDAVTETAVCLGCGDEFSYVPVLRKGGQWRTPKRQVCDGCRQRNAKKARQTYVQKQQRGEARAAGDHAYKGREGLASGLFKMSHREIAEALHLNEKTVAESERRMLLKIRSSAGLKELWANFLAEGCPVEAPEDPAALLLDYQMAVADFWVLHDKCARFVGPEEALECLKEITLFQARIVKFLEEMH